jgi:hypothetical protein
VAAGSIPAGYGALNEKKATARDDFSFLYLVGRRQLHSSLNLLIYINNLFSKIRYTVTYTDKY